MGSPVSLNENCAETFTRTALQTEETITSSSANGTSTTTTVQVNDYSIGFTRNTETKVNGVYVSGVSCLSATWKGENILAKTEKGTKIIFSNQNLKDLKQTGKDNVVFKFEVTYSNGEKIDYTIDQGYQFTVN